MCDHERIYENAIALEFPPMHRWICRKCGQEGVEKVFSHDDMEYRKVKRQWFEKRMKEGMERCSE
jgi:hypothetical protein